MATNFIYTGMSQQAYRKTNGINNARHIDYEADDLVTRRHSPKHRYIYFCTNNKKLKKEWMKKLKWEQKPYPKGENKNYILGDYIKYEVYDKNGNTSFVTKEKMKKNKLNFIK